MRFESDWLQALQIKKGLQPLPAGFMLKLLHSALDADQEAQRKLFKAHSWSEFHRSKECESVTKQVRSVLREVYGVFWDSAKRENLLKALLQSPSLENHNKILALHSSTKERLPRYEEVYKNIFAITGKPKRILDLACGLNPLSYPYLGCKPEYLANELCEADAAFVQAFFNGFKIAGQAFAFDLLEFKQTPFLSHLKSDVCFLFKALDSLEAIHWDFSEKLLPVIPSNFIVVSFSTKSLGGKKEIQSSKRSWFERLLTKQNLSSQTFSIPNEIFYVVNREQ